jgi:hypothetical protein
MFAMGRSSIKQEARQSRKATARGGFERQSSSQKIVGATCTFLPLLAPDPKKKFTDRIPLIILNQLFTDFDLQSIWLKYWIETTYPQNPGSIGLSWPYSVVK